MSEVDSIIDEALDDGLDDWVPLFVLVSAGRILHPDDPHRAKQVAIEAIRTVIMQHLMVPGDIADGSFKPWDMPEETAIARILGELDHVQWNVLDNLIVWFDNTKKGDERARANSDAST